MKKSIGIIIGIYFLTVGCAVNKSTGTGTSEAKLTDKQRLEYDYTFLDAHRAKMSGDLHKSAALFHQCVKIYPKSDAAYYELSNLYFAFSDIKSSIGYAQSALRIDPNNKWYYFQLARLYQANNQTDRSVEVYKELVKKFPKEYEYKVTLAGLLGEIEKYNEAISMLDEIEKSIGVTETVTLTKHNLFIKNGNYEKAFNEIQKLITAFPADIRFHGILAELYGRLGMDRQALETYQKILSIDPEYSLAHFSIADFYRGRGMFDESFVHYAKAFKDESINITDKISSIALFFDTPEVLNSYKIPIGQLVELIVAAGKDIPQARLLAADFFLRTDNITRAIIELKALVVMAPDNYPVLEQLIISLSFLSEYEELIQYGVMAEERFPDKTLVHYFLGIGYYQTGDYNKAAVALEKGLLIENESVELRNSFLLLLGDTFNKLREFERSDSCFQQVLNADPENSIAMNNWSYYLSVRGEKLEKAEKMSRKTIEKEPENSTYLDTYAWVVFKMGEYEKALYYIELAMNFIDEENAEILDHYGDILFKNNQLNAAVEMWKRAYNSDNTREEILKKIEDHEKK